MISGGSSLRNLGGSGGAQPLSEGVESGNLGTEVSQ